MERHKWNFILQAKGYDWSQRIIQDDVNKPISIHEYRYFKDLGEAFAELINWDLFELDPAAQYNLINPVRHFNTVQIVDAYSNAVLLEVSQITIDNAASKNIPAGVYVNFVMGPVAFESETGVQTPSDIFAPGTYLVCIASYSYDGTLKLNPSAAITNLDKAIDATIQNDWQYKMEVKEYYHGIPPSDQHTRVFNHTYHYDNMYEAFRDLIRTRPDKLDSFLSLSDKYGDKYIHSAGLFTRANNEVVSLACVRDQNFPDRVYDPGIHLRFGASIQKCEKLLGIDLTPDMHYELEERYQLIYNYTRDFQSFIPTIGFERLLKKTAGMRPPDVQAQLNPYAIQITWQPTAVNTSGAELPKDSQKAHAYGTIDEAIKALLDIDNELFDMPGIRSKKVDFYIESATIYDTADGKEIVSKFMANTGNPALPNGIYIRLNEEKTTIELLRAAWLYLPDFKKANSLSFLVCKMEEDKTLLAWRRKISKGSNKPRL